MLRYKVLIELYVLSCVLICSVYGDIIQVVVVLLCLLVAMYSVTSRRSVTLREECLRITLRCVIPLCV